MRNSVSQATVRGPPVIHGGSSGGSQEVSEEKASQKIVQTLNEWKIYPYVCAKTVILGWLSKEGRRSSSFHNFLYFNHYL